MAINQNNKDIKITLSKAQYEWLEEMSKKEKVSKSKIIASLLLEHAQASELSEAKASRQRINRKHIANGVIIEDPDSTYIGKDVEKVFTGKVVFDAKVEALAFSMDIQKAIPWLTAVYLNDFSVSANRHIISNASLI